MSDKERLYSPELDPQWCRLIEAGVQSYLETYYGVPFELTPEALVDKDEVVGDKTPYTNNDFGSLSSAEQEFIKGILFRELNFDMGTAPVIETHLRDVNAAAIGNYGGTNRPGTQQEVVYETSRSADEDLYVHLVYSIQSGAQILDGLFIGPRESIS